MPKTYRVEWSIDIDAASPAAAAAQALVVQRDPHSSATVFDVTEFDGSDAPVRIDLEADFDAESA